VVAVIRWVAVAAGAAPIQRFAFVTRRSAVAREAVVCDATNINQARISIVIVLVSPVTIAASHVGLFDVHDVHTAVRRVGMACGATVFSPRTVFVAGDSSTATLSVRSRQRRQKLTALRQHDV